MRLDEHRRGDRSKAGDQGKYVERDLEAMGERGPAELARDRALVAKAPWVPLVNFVWVDVVSARVKNYQYSPQWHGLIDQMWIR